MSPARRLTVRRGALLFLLGAGFGLAWGWRPMCAAVETRWPGSSSERFSVVGARLLSPDDVLSAAAVGRGTSLLQVDPEAVAARVARHPWVSDARSIALPPGHLLLGVVEREPVARVAVAGDPWWVDAEGLAFAPVDTEGGAFAPVDGTGPGPLPEILGIDDAEPERAHRLLDRAVRIADAVAGRAALPPVEEIHVGGRAPEALPGLRLSGDVRVVLGPGALHRKLSRLELLFVEFGADGLSGSDVDLRFGDRMVLRSRATPLGVARYPAQEHARAPERGSRAQ